MEKLDIDKAKMNVNVIDQYYNRNSVNVHLKDYGLFLRGNDGVKFDYYERNSIGYDIDLDLKEILSEHWVIKSQADENILVAPNYNSITIEGKTENVFYNVHQFTKAEKVTLDELVENIPYYFNVIIFNVNNISNFSGATPEVLYEYAEQLNELIQLDSFIKIYKKNNIFFIFND